MITVATQKLIDVLTDAMQTAEDWAGGGIHVATHRAPWRDEPGAVDLLSLTSTDRYVIGHTWIPVSGTLEPSVWPLREARRVLAICKTFQYKSKCKDQEHTVDISMSLAEPSPDAEEGQHPGWTVNLRETPALWGDDAGLTVDVLPEGKFPLKTVFRALTGVSTTLADDDEYVETPLTLWSAHVLKPVIAVASRRNAAMQFFRSPERRVQIVQIGDTWLGAAMPGTPSPGAETSEPSIEPVLGDDMALLSLKDTVAEMKAAGITILVDKPKGAVAQQIADAINEPDPNQIAIDDAVPAGVE